MNITLPLPLALVLYDVNCCPAPNGKDTKASAYTAYVRPTLEYCSAVWDPHSKSHTHAGKWPELIMQKAIGDTWDGPTSP